MPLKPNAELVRLEVMFRTHLNKLADASLSIGTPLPTTIVVETPKAKDTPHDEDCEFLCDFFSQMFQVLNHSSLIKASFESRLQLKIDVSKTAQEAVNALTLLIQYTNYLQKEKPELFDYLVTKTAGRHALYFMICLAIMHLDPFGLAPSGIRWIDAMQSVPGYEAERDCLGYLKAILLEPGMMLGAARKDGIEDPNPFIRAHHALSIHEGQTKHELAVQVAQVLAIEFNYPSTLPLFLKKYIQLFLNTKAIIAIQEQSTEIAVFLLMYNRYLNASLCQLTTKTGVIQVEDLLNHIFNTLEHMRWYNYVYSLYVDNNLVFYRLRNILLCAHVCLYHSLNTPSLLSMTHLSLVRSVAQVFERKLHETWSVEHELAKEFWEAASALFQPTKVVHGNFVTVFNLHIEELIKGLIQFNHINDAFDLFKSFIEYSELAPIVTAEKKPYIQEIVALSDFTQQLKQLFAPTTEEKIAASNLKSLLKDIKAQKYTLRKLNARYLSTQYPSLLPHLKQRLQDSIGLLSSFLDYTKMPNAITQDMDALFSLLAHYLSILAASSNELKTTFQSLKHDEYISFLTDDLIRTDEMPTQKDKAQAKGKKQKKGPLDKKDFESKSPSSPTMSDECPSPSRLSFFQSAPNYIINKSELPLALMTLANRLKADGIDLILTGGAVTHLLLRKPNPNDYDCMVFNTDLERLLQKLHEYGYNKSKMVGKHRPIIKIQHEEGGESLDLDIINFPLSEGSIDKNMCRVMKARDFKLSALYIFLSSPGENLLIQGHGHAIHTVNKKKISLVNERAQIFSTDPICLIRLAKIMLQYDDFTFDDKLNKILRETDQHHCFKQFLCHAHNGRMNQGRLSTALEMMFSRFDYQSVLMKLLTLGILPAMTELKPEHLGATLSLLEPYGAYDGYSKKLKFFQWIAIHFYLSQGETKSDKNWIFYNVARSLYPGHTITIDFIKQSLWNTKDTLFVNDAELSRMIESIEAYYKRVGLDTIEEAAKPSWRA